jgi:hypothetical protein
MQRKEGRMSRKRLRAVGVYMHELLFLHHIFLFSILFAVTWMPQSCGGTVFPKRKCLLSLCLPSKYQLSPQRAQSAMQKIKGRPLSPQD